ncbi:MAG: hypothetical protein JOZ87_40790 [Chloroflexi bacterium]|nr:hypothetical protein [Chloroflexota bacterium]
MSRIALMLVLLVSGVASPGGTALGQVAPAMSLNPAQGAVGTSVTATASGFAPGEMLSVFVFPMTEPVTTATADANGGARIAFTVPNLGPAAAGAHQVSVQGSSGTAASATFTVTGGSQPVAPAMSLSPTQGAVGTSVTATASGFAAGETLSLFVFPVGGLAPQQPLATATADANGGARIAFTVPNVEAGGQQVLVASPSGASASATFTVTGGSQPIAPALSLNPTQGAVGVSVTATASGFAPGEMLSLYVFPMTELVTTATADANGGARIAFTVPNLGPAAAGAHQVSVQGSSGTAADATFTVTTAGATATPTAATTPSAATATPAPNATATPAATASTTAPALTRDNRYFAQTGFRIDTDAFYIYFSQRGGVRTFGYPSSRTFRLDGFQVQIFQRLIMQLQPNGSVQTLNLLDPGLMPYTQINGSTYPAPDPSVVGATPPVSSPTYATDIITFTQQNAPNTFEGQPVNYFQTFSNTVTCEDAFPDGACQPNLLPGLSLEIWGAPTSKPAYDPTNRNFIYLRFQRGIMHFDATCNCTQGLLLADYFKAILTGQNLPADLNQQAQGTKYYRQYDPTKPAWIARPNDLPASDLTYAFVPG